MSEITTRPKLLDLFCCEGGAAMGYHRAGFDVYGVDIVPQPRYPFPFHLGDALDFVHRLLLGEAVPFTHSDGTAEWLTLTGFAVVHASPPCHDHSALAAITGSDGTADLLPETRRELKTLGKPYVIENVEGAEMVNALTLCGTQFGLVTETVQRGVVWLKRHRQFESNMRLIPPDGHRTCVQGKKVIGVYGRGDGGGRGWKGSFKDRQAVMGIGWMDREGLAQSIPPAYCEFIGAQILASLGLSS